jgi:ABC-type nitrate/sulfonate/bicarbonate transport system substrate-binding protein
MSAALQTKPGPARRTSAAALRIGYVPLADAAPLLMAEARGLFRQLGLDVRLERELGWGSIREKLVYGELDAAHAPGGLIFSILCGTHARPRDVRTDLVLNLQGNAITLSRRLWQKGVHDAATLRLLLRSEAPRKPAFAVVSLFSSHLWLLRKWFTKAGIDADRDVRIAVLPPPLVAEHMRAGLIDGFCVGEPWNSASALTGEGWIVATSSMLEPRHPEKVLIASQSLADDRPDEYAALQEAIVTACRFCDTPGGRTAIVDLFQSRKLFPVSREVLANGLIGPLHKGDGLEPEKSTLVHFFHGEANRATRDRAVWLLDSLCGPAALPLDSTQRRSCLDAFHDRLYAVAPTRKTNRKKSK